MIQKVYSVFIRSLLMLVLLAASQLLPGNAHAQSRLMYYWNFNTDTEDDTVGTPGCQPVSGLNIVNNRIRPLSADYSITGSTALSTVWYTRQSGVTNLYPQFGTYGVCFTYLDFKATGGTTLNNVSGLGATAGGYLRVRNPSDSMELRFYIPSANYQNITFSYESQYSSTAGGNFMCYSYSLDSGVTWKNTGLSKTTDAEVAAWGSTAFSISITDPAANNNPKLVFRIRDSVNSNGNSGNQEYDNIAVKGDTLITPQTLIYFWDFNSLPVSASYTWGPFTGSAPGSSPFPYINPDYTRPGFISANAKVHMDYYPSLADSMSNFDAASTFFDDVQNTTGTPDFDSVNSNWPSALAPLTTFSVVPVPAGNGIRPRNPLDSTYLYYYMPTTNYKNILLKYATQTSSTGSGDSIQTFNYSVDGGATWRLSGISEAYDSAYLAGMPTSNIPYRSTPVVIQFTDPAANNNPLLVFRIGFKGRTGNTTAASGNNRFDNISVQGDSIIQALPTITTTPVAFGPYCSSISNTITVACTHTGTITGTYLVQMTNAAGVFPADFTSNIIGSGTTSPITAVIPAGTTPGSIYRVRVINAYPQVYGSDNGTDINISSALNPNTGTPFVCTGLTTTLSNATTGGTWSTSTSSIATVGASTGSVTGSTVGNAIVVYTSPSGCSATSTVTVNQVPTAITNSGAVCIGSNLQLSDGIAIGTWSSSNTSVATIGSSSGLVSGISSNTVTITYGTPGCSVTTSLTVNPLPSLITGAGNVCVNATITLSDASTGTWSSSNTSLATVNSGSNIVTGVSAGTPNITFTSSTTGCNVTASVTVLAIPAPISGGPGCVGTTTTFTDATAFGAWSSSNLSAAIVGSSTGVVSGVALGSSNISYTLTTGCFVTYSVSINALPASVSGTPIMCVGANAQLSDATPGGTWSSSNFALATVNSTSGFVTGVVAGNPIITYTSPVGCTAVITATVNPLPALISGQTSVYCIGSTANLSDVSGGGTWTSGTTTIATISSVGLVTGVAAGTSVITYTLPTGCLTTLAENISSTPAPINGPSTSCVGTNTSYTDATAFGEWSSSNASIAAIGSGTGIVTGEAFGTAVITYALSSFCLTTATVNVSNPPVSIIGNTQVCVNANTTLSDAGGGTWSSNIPPLATVGLNSGVVSGIVAGDVVISYTLPNGCYTTTSVTVNPIPSIIGSSTICQGAPTTLTGSITGGTWSSSNSSAAIINLNSGLLTAVGLGSTFITYTLPLPTGCSSTENVTVSLPPSGITGAGSICAGGLMTTYTDAGGGGWYSSNPSVATIGFGTGVLTSVAQGTTIITYSLGTSCIATTTVTVNPLPAGVTGVTSICPGLSTTLSDITPGGTWTTANTTLAVVGSGTGMVTGVLAGSPVITYILPTGCIASTTVVVNSVPSITGITQVCAGSTTALSNTSLGGTWSSSNIGLATAGLSTGVVTGVAVGTPLISYTLLSGCITTTSLTVDAALTAIVGNSGVCLGGNTTLSDAATGGVWSSNNSSVATIDPATGAITTSSAGTTNIIYATSSWCTATTTVTVNPLPAAIAGANTVCLHLAVTLSDANTGGTWSSGSTAVTIVAGSGIATGAAAGTSVITYTLPTTCINTTTLTVNPLPSAITGTRTLCQNTTVTLSDATAGGLWTSSNSSVAAIGSATGILTGVGSGVVNTTYTSSLGCIATASVTINPAPNAYGVTGGGSYCAGDPGVHIGLNNSDLGISYQLYKSAVTTGAPKNGVSGSIDFGLFTAAGTYTAVATNTTTGCTSLMNDSAVVVINPSVAPQVMLSTGVGAGDTVCLGSTITFTAQTHNGGTAPVYVWSVNSTHVVALDSTYSYIPANGDIVAVKVTNNSVCAVPDSAVDTMTIHTLTPTTPSVFITVSPATTIAIGQADTLTAVPTNCGSAPHYQWYKNGILIPGATNEVYTSSSFANGDSLSCRVTTSGACGGQLTYNSVVIAVFPAGVTPVITGNSMIQLIPNPNKGMFTVKGSMSTMQDEKVMLTVTDMLGQVIYTNNIIAHNGNVNEQVTLSNSLANGMYILEVKSGTENKMFHFVIGK